MYIIFYLARAKMYASEIKIRTKFLGTETSHSEKNPPQIGKGPLTPHIPVKFNLPQNLQSYSYVRCLRI